MIISDSAWGRFIRQLAAISNRAAAEMQKYIANHGGIENIDRDEAINYAHALCTKYGEATAALSAEMYDALAEASRVSVAAAVPAETATLLETAKAINGTMKTGNADVVASSVYRLVKMAGVDTTMKNAIRDGAEWAWIPQGETCAFCIMLASQGWQRASKKVLKGGHAEHIHANCDCTFAIRFDRETNVQGYAPKRYEKMLTDADKNGSWNDRVNALRNRLNEKAREAEGGE